MTAAALALLALLAALSLPFWRDLPVIRRFRLRAGLVLAIAVGLLALAAWFAINGPGRNRTARELAIALSIVASLAAGGPVAKALLRLADRGTPASPQGPARTTLLTGGAWIGALERIAVTTTLLARWPDGLALILAVKGLGRYPELRNAGYADQSAIAERFIIGTFASALWAAACAGVGLELLR
ncbi:MAG TPA: hypothetical protein VI248_19150 [Kineosporiaceae bacterium]